VHPCERTGRPVGLWFTPDRACERAGCPVGLEMDQESIGITLVYVGVREGDIGRLVCGFVLLHSIFYILYSIFYILYSIFYILHSSRCIPVNAQGDQLDCGCIPDRACERTGSPVGLEVHPCERPGKTVGVWVYP